VVVIGSRGPVEINPRDTMSRDASILGMTLFNVPPDEMRGIHAALVAGLENNALRPIVGSEIPLAEAARAHREILENAHAGKIVLTP
jgi:NADPH2:quinone reductase